MRGVQIGGLLRSQHGDLGHGRVGVWSVGRRQGSPRACGSSHHHRECHRGGSGGGSPPRSGGPSAIQRGH
jgi:hypothetical protein